nr:DUF4815 domain-containing protein [Wolbachia endosymbiont of Atemnus politus]
MATIDAKSTRWTTFALLHSSDVKNGEGVKVVNNAIHAVPMNELEAMKIAINDLYTLVAQERLRSDANSREPTTKKEYL